MTSKMHKSNVLGLARTYRAARSDTDIAIREFFSSLACPKSLAAWLLYENREYQQLVDLEANPLDFNNPADFRDAYTAVNFLAKADFLELAVSKKDAAITKFLKFEDQCASTNDRLRNLSVDPLYKGANVWLLNATIQKISKILTPFDSEEFVDNGNWGPGVSTLLKGSHVSAANKFDSDNGITRNLYSFVEPWFHLAYPLWHRRLTTGLSPEAIPFHHEVGNVIVTVPKNSKTDRVIAIEPGINLWFQKSIGAMVKKRLRRWNIDLTDQTRNQDLAYIGSKTNRLATIDFSSASDSISLETVRLLLPPDWFSLMDATRSIYGSLDGSAFKWKKFSSMGNGFTFELESLIFFAAALAVCEYDKVDSKEVSVFGDDVIIPSRQANLFSQFCEFLGFTVNPKKSYHDSYFRESCGSHFFRGLDVKPLYFESRLSNVQSLYKLANGVRILAHRRSSHCGCDASFQPLYRYLLHRAPTSLRLKTPLSHGDVGFISNFDEACPSKERGGFGSYRFRGLIDVGILTPFDKESLLLASLWELSRAPLPLAPETQLIRRNVSVASYLKTQEFPLVKNGNSHGLRGKTQRRLSNLSVMQWYDLGPWS